MEINWEKSVKWVRLSEGGNDDDPLDHGGRTSRGITQREYDAYCQMAGLPHGDVWQAPDPVINDIYHKSYWNPWSPTLPAGIDYLFFDVSVLSGPHEATILLQRALGFAGVQVDGHIGMVTSAAIVHATKGDASALIKLFSAQRLHFYKSIVERTPSQRKWLRGWSNRVVATEKNALTLLGV